MNYFTFMFFLLCVVHVQVIYTESLKCFILYHLVVQNHWQNTLSSFYSHNIMFKKSRVIFLLKQQIVMTLGSGHNCTCVV